MSKTTLRMPIFFKILLILFVLVIVPVGYFAFHFVHTAGLVSEHVYTEGMEEITFSKEESLQKVTDLNAEIVYTRFFEIESVGVGIAEFVEYVYSRIESFYGRSTETYSYYKNDRGYYTNRVMGDQSVLIAPLDVSMTDDLKKEIKASEFLDVTFRSALKKLPLIYFVYFVSENFGRCYPAVDLSPLPQAKDLKEYIFYFGLAGPERNPERKAVWTYPYIDIFSKDWVITCAVPVYLGDLYKGVVCMDIKVNDIKELLSRDSRVKGGYGFLLYSDGVVLGVPEEGYKDFQIPRYADAGKNTGVLDILRIGDDYKITSSADFDVRRVAQKILRKEGNIIKNVNLGNESKIISYSKVGDTGFIYLDVFSAKRVILPVVSAFKEAKNIADILYKSNLIIAVSVFSIIILISYLAAGNIAAKVRKLVEGSEQFSSGNLAYSIKMEGGSEFKTIANSMNDMAVSLKRNQEQLIQHERLSSMAELLSGAAHELNNPLSGVVGYAEILKGIEKDPQKKEKIEYLEQSAKRCKKIVQNMLSFARKVNIEAVPTDVNKLVAEIIDMRLYQTKLKGIQLKFNPGKDMPQTCLDPYQIEQVLINLLLNAEMALEETSGKIRKIEVSTSCDAETVFIDVSDNGIGIPEKDLGKIFEPFFTTKSMKLGVGLGLSLVYGIIKSHGGSISVKSKQGAGTDFTVKLPIKSLSEFKPRHKRPIEFSLPSKAKILVVEDEKVVAELIKEVIEGDGQIIEIANDGEEGLKALRKNNFDMIIVDYKMPKMTGEDFFNRALKEKIARRKQFLFMTGDSLHPETQNFFSSLNQSYLEKPFTILELKNIVYAHLSEIQSSENG
ncbi:MAG: ATP-binding protein [bacterium]|nr:ATP-binding protein [bacterium]